MATVTKNPRVLEALDRGLTYDDIRQYAIQHHEELMNQGKTREEADQDMYQTWGLKSNFTRGDADRAQWASSLFFEDQTPQPDEPEQTPEQAPEQVPQTELPQPDIQDQSIEPQPKGFPVKPEQPREVPDVTEFDIPESDSQGVAIDNPEFMVDLSQNSSQMQNGVRKKVARPKPNSIPADNAVKSLVAGWQRSGLGLYIEGGLPTLQAPVDGVISNALFAVGQFLGDAPAFAVGGLIGGMSGSAIAPGPGTLAGASAGAFGTAAYVRSALMQAYEKGEAVSISDLMARWGNSMLAFANDASLGAIMPGVNKLAMDTITKAIGDVALQQAAKTATTAQKALTAIKATAAGMGIAAAPFTAELGTMIAHQSLVERKLPTMDDMNRAAIGLCAIKYFSGGWALAKQAYINGNVHPKDLSILAQVDKAKWQKFLQDATKALIRPQRSVWAIETENQPKYSEGDKAANLAGRNDNPWLFVSDTAAEERLADLKIEDRNPNNPAVIKANEAKATYENQMKKNERPNSPYQKTKQAYKEAQKRLTDFETGQSRADAIRAELIEKGLIKEDDPRAIWDPHPNSNSIYNLMDETRREAKKWPLSDERGPNTADRKWAAKVYAVFKKHEKASQKDPGDIEARAQLKEEVRMARAAFEKEEHKVVQLERDWQEAEKHVPRTTSDTPYRTLREMYVHNWAATMHLDGLGKSGVNALAQKFFASEEGKNHPMAKLFKKRGATKAQKDQACYDALANPSQALIDFLCKTKWTLDELKLFGGERFQKALAGAKPGEVKRISGQDIDIQKDKKAQYKFRWQGIYMENGFLPLRVRSVQKGELSSSEQLQAWEEAVGEIRQQIMGPKTGLSGLWARLKNKWKHNEFDMVDRFEALNRDHTYDGKISPSYLAATEVAPSSGKAEQYIEEGMRDWKTNRPLEGRRSLGSIFQDKSIKLDVLDTILLADAGLNAVQTGKPTFIAKRASLSVMERVRTKKELKAYKEALHAVRQFNHDLIEYMYDAGLITKEQRKEMHGSRDTLSVERVVTSIGDVNASRTALEDIAEALGMAPDAKLTYSDALKKWRAANPGMYKSPLNQLIFSATVSIRSAHINAAKKAIAADWGMEPVSFSKDKTLGYAEKSSIPLQRIEWREHGKKKTAWIDPEIYMAVSQLDASSRAISNFLYKWVLDQPANLLRAGTTLSPSFAIKNAFIDQFTLGIQTRTGAKPFVDIPWALAEIVAGKNGHGSELYKQWLADGGMSGSYSKYGRNELISLIDSTKKRDWQNTIKDLSQGNLSALGRLVNPFPAMRKLIKGLSAVSETGEMLPRFTEYCRALEQGYSRKEAAYMSRTATLDFARAGASIRGLNRIAAFLNAGIQGFDRIIRTATANPHLFMVNVLNYLVVPTMWLSMAEASMMISAPNSVGADKARNRPDWMRAAFWPIYFGDDYEFCVNIPKPHGILQLLTLPFEAWIHDAAKNNKIRDPFIAMAENGLTETLKNAFPNPLDFQATGLKLAAEVATNHQFFTDNAIISSKYEKLAPEERYKENTSGIAWQIGRWLQTLSRDTHLPIPEAVQAPLVIDHVIRGLTGQLGSQITQILGSALPIDKPKVERDWTHNPFVKQFFFHMPSYNAKIFTEFNEVSEKLNERYNTYKRLVSMPNATDRDRALKYAMEGPLVNMNTFKTLMGKQGQAIDRIYHDSRIPANEKGALIDRFMVNQIRIAKQGLDLANRLQEQFDLNQKAKKRK